LNKNKQSALAKAIGTIGFFKSKPWYGDGLRFSCTQCGNCCSGPGGEVPVLRPDRIRLAEFLGISEEAFNRTYTTPDNATRKTRYLKLKPSRRNTANEDCIFLDRESIPGKAICSVHEAKPPQCSAWPFWPASLESPDSWTAAGEHCPGIGRGASATSKEDIESFRRSVRQLERAMGSFEHGW
jgi:hypothetical protein